MTYNPRTPARELTPFGNFELHPTHLRTGTVTPLATSTEAEVAAAARLVTRRVEDPADRSLILDALGLIGAVAGSLT